MLDRMPSWAKDLLVLVAVFGLILGGLFVFTGTWPPAVIVESGSMMHRDSEVKYGRVGTIDPGDMVLVKKIDIDDETDVTTWAEGGRNRYGSPGDVIVYYPGNTRERTPIIHRAMLWINVSLDDEGAPVYRVRWNADEPCPNSREVPVDGANCVFGNEGVTIPDAGVFTYKPDRSGVVTKGDNPFTNARADQQSGLSTIVQLDWIEGKSRAEIPWLGLIKLALAKTPNERSPPPSWMRVGSAYAPQDLWIMLGVSLFVLIGLPVGYDAYKALEDRRKNPPAPKTLATRGAPPPQTPPESPALEGDTPSDPDPEAGDADAPPPQQPAGDEPEEDGPKPFSGFPGERRD